MTPPKSRFDLKSGPAKTFDVQKSGISDDGLVNENKRAYDIMQVAKTQISLHVQAVFSSLCLRWLDIFRPIQYSIRLIAKRLDWSIACIEGSQVNIPNKILYIYFFL